MSWSLLNHMVAEHVDAVLSEVERVHGEPIPDKDQARAGIHAVLWHATSRPGSTAAGYAWMNLMEALGIKRWSFRDDWSDVFPRPQPAAEEIADLKAQVAALTAEIAALKDGAVPDAG